MGIPVPAIIDDNTWQLAQQKRENARTLITDSKGWLLQGMCYCGQYARSFPHQGEGQKSGGFSLGNSRA